MALELGLLLMRHLSSKPLLGEFLLVVSYHGYLGRSFFLFKTHSNSGSMRRDELI